MSEIRRAGAWYARRYGQCHYGDTYDALFPLCVATSAGFCTRRTPSEGMGWIENSPHGTMRESSSDRVEWVGVNLECVYPRAARTISVCMLYTRQWTSYYVLQGCKRGTTPSEDRGHAWR